MHEETLTNRGVVIRVEITFLELEQTEMFEEIFPPDVYEIMDIINRLATKIHLFTRAMLYETKAKRLRAFADDQKEAPLKECGVTPSVIISYREGVIIHTFTGNAINCEFGDCVTKQLFSAKTISTAKREIMQFLLEYFRIEKQEKV